MNHCQLCAVNVEHETKFVCLHCDDDYTLCTSCEKNDKIRGHYAGTHSFAKVKPGFDLSKLDAYKVKNGSNKVLIDTMFDSFQMQTFAFKTYEFDDDEERIQDPLELVKEMLRYENALRLSAETIREYEKSQDSDWKTVVTEGIQKNVVNSFMSVSKFYKTEEEGIMFLRSAVGNFPDHIEELMECANYVKYTQFCVRGPLRVGDRLGEAIPEDLGVYHIDTFDKHTLKDLLTDDVPNVILSSSYT
eukprot:TRINITY_DN7324_c0_g1_i1.p1 TRINITY_DN7324_c0_g1~~TRINITY_DN7324_c0_g1_i1.p1  ORF type:complete len:246 (+),score=36.32 TRINITY_DN7324_c0_g1_i1:111-848(+)